MLKIFRLFINFIKNRKRMLSDTELKSIISQLKNTITKLEFEAKEAKDFTSGMIYDSSLDTSNSYLRSLERIQRLRERKIDTYDAHSKK